MGSSCGFSLNAFGLGPARSPGLECSGASPVSKAVSLETMPAICSRMVHFLDENLACRGSSRPSGR